MADAASGGSAAASSAAPQRLPVRYVSHLGAAVLKVPTCARCGATVQPYDAGCASWTPVGQAGWADQDLLEDAHYSRAASGQSNAGEGPPRGGRGGARWCREDGRLRPLGPLRLAGFAKKLEHVARLYDAGACTDVNDAGLPYSLLLQPRQLMTAQTEYRKVVDAAASSPADPAPAAAAETA